jgi:hypothetical protein
VGALPQELGFGCGMTAGDCATADESIGPWRSSSSGEAEGLGKRFPRRGVFPRGARDEDRKVQAEDQGGAGAEPDSSEGSDALAARPTADRAGTRKNAGVSSAPDFCEPILGWRAWHAVERRGDIYLASLFHRVRWPCLEPLVGTCGAPTLPWLRKRRHASPQEHCDCGIYASSLETAAAYVAEPTDRRAWPVETVYSVIGEVALWGEVIECKNGWRAALAYPHRLFLPAEGTLRAARLRQGLERYGVPVQLIDTAGANDAAFVVQAILRGSALTFS